LCGSSIDEALFSPDQLLVDIAHLFIKVHNILAGTFS